MRELQRRIEDGSIPEPNSGCWLWLNAVSGLQGYGQISSAGVQIYAHRLSYVAFNGPIPVGLFVCHKCDVRTCVNPQHLFLGTAGDNARDRDFKGRSGTHGLRGERSRTAKLNDEKVRAILADERSQTAIARDYGVTQSQISRIKNGRVWEHVQ